MCPTLGVYEGLAWGCLNSTSKLGHFSSLGSPSVNNHCSPGPATQTQQNGVKNKGSCPADSHHLRLRYRWAAAALPAENRHLLRFSFHLFSRACVCNVWADAVVVKVPSTVLREDWGKQDAHGAIPAKRCIEDGGNNSCCTSHPTANFYRLAETDLTNLKLEVSSGGESAWGGCFARRSLGLSLPTQLLLT